MYIKQLLIKESYPSEKQIREVSFIKGVNFIVDDGDERGNGIGKTTTLKVIDVCFGTQDRKYIYTDFEMDVENIDLKDYINNNKLYAEVILTRDLDDTNAEKYSLRVDLYERGYRYIDNTQYAIQDYNKTLSKLVFDNEYDRPTFRQLIGMFIRIDQKSDNDKFLRYANSYTSDSVYENIYSYLFQLNDHAVSQELLRLKEKISTLKADIKKLLKLNNIKSINVIQQLLISTNKEIEEARKKLAVLVDASEMKKNEDAIMTVRTKYASIADEIDQNEFKAKKISGIINDARGEVKKTINVEVLKNLYDETRSNFSELTKTFNDLLKFNRELVGNKIKYFEQQLNKVNARLGELNKKKDQLFDQYKDVVVLIKNSDVDSYVALQGTFEKAVQEKGKLEKVLELYTTLSDELNFSESILDNTTEESFDPNASVALFNEFFTEYSEKIVQESYLLYLTEKTFPIGIANVKAGLSTGTKKSVISAFDLAYQSFSIRKQTSGPRFIIHDVIETMDSIALDNTIKISNEIGCQYIVAVLKDKISNNKNVQPKNIRLTLSDSNKLFCM